MSGKTLRDYVVEWIGEAFPQLVYGSVYEYRVAAVNAGRLDLVPVSTKLLGPQSRVYQWTLSGAEPTPAVGTSVVLAFLDADPSKPIVVGYGPQRTAPGGNPTAAKIDTSGVLTLGPSASAVQVGTTFAATAITAVGHFPRFGDNVTVGTAAGILTLTAPAPVSTGKS